MKTVNVCYWLATMLVVLVATLSGFAAFFLDAAKASYVHLGFPDYFRMELGLAKILGAVALLLPLSPRLKEWVYAGFTINFLSAAIAYVAVGDPFYNVVFPVVALGALLTSYFTYHALQDQVLQQAAGRQLPGAVSAG